MPRNIKFDKVKEKADYDKVMKGESIPDARQLNDLRFRSQWELDEDEAQVAYHRLQEMTLVYQGFNGIRKNEVKEKVKQKMKEKKRPLSVTEIMEMSKNG